MKLQKILFLLAHGILLGGFLSAQSPDYQKIYAGFSAEKLSGKGADMLFRKVHIVDLRKGNLLKNRKILVGNGKYLKVRKNWFPMWGKRARKAEKMDFSGKYWVPPIQDMHSHMQCSAHDRLLYLLHGVTGVRVHDVHPAILKEKEWVQSGMFLSPMVIGGATPPKLWANLPREVVELANYKQEFQKSKDRGFDFLQIGRDASKKDLPAILEAGLRMGMPVSVEPDGISGLSVFWQEKGSVSIENLGQMLSAGEVEAIDQIDYQAAGKWKGFYCPNLVSVEHIYSEADFFEKLSGPEFQLATPAQASDWRRFYLPYEGRGYINSEIALQDYQNREKLVKGIYSKGGKFLVGTEFGKATPLLIAGQSVWEEMNLLGKAGIQPVDVWRAATIYPQDFLSGKERNVQPDINNRANFLLLNFNPLESVGNSDGIMGIYWQGVFISRKERKTQLEKLKSRENIQ